MTLVLGARHIVTGTGQVAIANPVGLAIALAGIPSYVARDAGTPLRFHRMGRVAVGAAAGWRQNVDLVANPQLVFPFDGEDTLLGWTLLAGCTATIDELASSSTYPVRPAPWDRGLTVWSQSANAAPGPTTGTTTGWSYTVPAGKVLVLASAMALFGRISLATSAGIAQAIIAVNGFPVVEAADGSNVVGTSVRDALSGGPLYLPAASTVVSTYNNPDVGGLRIVWLLATGYLFNA